MRRRCSFPLAAMLLTCMACSAQPARAQQPKACTPTVTGELKIERLESKVLGSEQTLRIWLPPGYHDAANAQRHYPVLYMFDAQNLFDRCTNQWHTEWEMDETLTRLIMAGRVEPIVVVGLDAPDEGPLRASQLLEDQDRSLPQDFEPHGDRLPAFFATELMPHIEAAYRVKTGRASTAIGGSSYGGMAAGDLLVEMPRDFGLGLLESPSCTPGNGALARRTQMLAIAPLRAYVGVGEHEAAAYREALTQMGYTVDVFERNFVRNAKAVAHNFAAAGGTDARVRFVTDPEGHHDEASWRRRFPAAIEFLFPAKTSRAP